MYKSSSKILVKDGSFIIHDELSFATVKNIWIASLKYLEKSENLVFDFSNVTNCKSVALALMIAWIQYAKKNNKKLTFKSIPSQIMTIASVSGVDKLLGSFI